MTEAVTTPLVVLAVIGALGLVLRWAFARDTTVDVARLLAPRSPAESDFGLLTAVAVADTPEEAAGVRARLANASIRSTTSTDHEGRQHVLVFAHDLDRARSLLA